MEAARAGPLRDGRRSLSIRVARAMARRVASRGGRRRRRQHRHQPARRQRHGHHPSRRWQPASGRCRLAPRHLPATAAARREAPRGGRADGAVGQPEPTETLLVAIRAAGPQRRRVRRRLRRAPQRRGVAGVGRRVAGGGGGRPSRLRVAAAAAIGRVDGRRRRRQRQRRLEPRDARRFGRGDALRLRVAQPGAGGAQLVGVAAGGREVPHGAEHGDGRARLAGPRGAVGACGRASLWRAPARREVRLGRRQRRRQRGVWRRWRGARVSLSPQRTPQQLRALCRGVAGRVGVGAAASLRLQLLLARFERRRQRHSAQRAGGLAAAGMGRGVARRVAPLHARRGHAWLLRLRRLHRNLRQPRWLP